MQVTIGLAQTKHPEDGDVIALVERFAAEAHSRGVDMLVFPESLMSRYEKEAEAFVREAEPVDGAFATALDKVAARYGLWMVYTLNERNPKGNPFNTAIIVDSTGTKRGIYRKIHLFDTDFTHESDRMSAGSALFEPIDTPFGKIGLAIATICVSPSKPVRQRSRGATSSSIQPLGSRAIPRPSNGIRCSRRARSRMRCSW